MTNLSKSVLRIYLFIFSSIFVLTAAVSAQIASGGGFTLEQAAIVSGGGTLDDATNNIYKIEGAIGQPAAGTNITNPPYNLYGGFWAFAPLAPTAASVSVGGRILTAGGQGIRNAVVILTEQNGAVRTASTGSFGFYQFNEIAAGQTVVISVFSRRFYFSQPTRVLNVSDNIGEINFVSDN